APALDSLDRSLDGTALALERLVRVEHGQPVLPMPPEVDLALRADRFDRVYWVVLGPQGRVLGGDAGLARMGGERSGAEWRFTDAQFEGNPVRLALHTWNCTATERCEARVAETLNKGHGVESAVLTAASTAMVVEALVL